MATKKICDFCGEETQRYLTRVTEHGSTAPRWLEFHDLFPNRKKEVDPFGEHDPEVCQTCIGIMREAETKIREDAARKIAAQLAPRCVNPELFGLTRDSF